jgi:hypothetical protein
LLEADYVRRGYDLQDPPAAAELARAEVPVGFLSWMRAAWRGRWCGVAK